MEVSAFDLDCELDADPGAVTELRHLVAQLVAVPAAGTTRGDDIRLAVTEAVTNVVVHAYIDAPRPASVRLQAVRETDGLRVAVSDTGRGVTPRVDSPGLGMGMAIMAQLSDDLDVQSTTAGSTVTMWFALPTITHQR